MLLMFRQRYHSPHSNSKYYYISNSKSNCWRNYSLSGSSFIGRALPLEKIYKSPSLIALCKNPTVESIPTPPTQPTSEPPSEPTSSPSTEPNVAPMLLETPKNDSICALSALDTKMSQTATIHSNVPSNNNKDFSTWTMWSFLSLASISKWDPPCHPNGIIDPSLLLPRHSAIQCLT